MHEIIPTLALWAIPVLLAITLHEAAHGYTARYFGDPTAALAGRITLNPLRHIDPIGTIAVPLIILLASNMMGTGGILFGWAKPVPVDFSRLHNPKANMLWVAAAGPIANFIMALGWALVKLFSLQTQGDFTPFLRGMAEAGIIINIVLMVLNLLPIPPLDGGRIAVSLLPHELARAYAKIEPFGMLILLILLFSGLLGAILFPFIELSRNLIQFIIGV